MSVPSLFSSHQRIASCASSCDYGMFNSCWITLLSCAWGISICMRRCFQPQQPPWLPLAILWVVSSVPRNRTAFTDEINEKSFHQHSPISRKRRTSEVAQSVRQANQTESCWKCRATEQQEKVKRCWVIDKWGLCQDSNMQHSTKLWLSDCQLIRIACSSVFD